MKSSTPNSQKKRNVSNHQPDRTIKGTSKKSGASVPPREQAGIAVNDLFLHFTANIIKEDTLFTR